MLIWRQRSFLALAVMLFLSTARLFSQTDPTPYSLATGNYTLTEWASTNPAGTYPANMIFRVHASGNPVLTTALAGDYTGAYNGTSGARMNGLGTAGFSFVNNSGGTLGGAILGLNTMGRQNIRVTWTGGTVVAANPTQVYAIRLQYRVGTTAAWTDVMDAGNNPVEYTVNTNGHTQVLGPVTLPAAAENQPVVQLLWKYYQVAVVSGATRPQLSVDDITVASDPAAGSPTRLAITQINPASPSTNRDFSVTVQAQDNSGSPRNVISATSFTFSVASGTGTLGGTVTGTIPAGQSTTTVTGVTYNTAESNVQLRATRTGGDNLTAGTSSAFTVQLSASQLVVVGAPVQGMTRNPFATFTVEARRSNGTVDPNYTGAITLTKVSGPGNLNGTLTANPSNGVSSFGNISFDQAGFYTVQASAPGLTPATFGVTVQQAPVMTELLIPQFIKSTVGSGQSTRIPSFALIRLDSLMPNMTYRFVSGNDTVLNSTSVGAGNNMHYNAATGQYTYSTSKYFGSGPANNTNSSYFTTGPNQRSITLWINNSASTNAIFNAGNNLRWVLTLADTNGNRITRLVSNGTSRTVDFGTGAAQATGIANRRSYLMPGSYVALFDNAAGTGAPLSTAIVQEEGGVSAAAVPFYAELDDDSTAWATIIPNTLPNGVRRIEQRSASGQLMNVMTDADGIWNVSTVNPTGGVSALYLGDLVLGYPNGGQILCRGNAHTITWNSFGVDTLAIELSPNGGANYDRIATVPASAMSYTWNIPQDLTTGTNYMLRLASIKQPFVASTGTAFSVAAAPEITAQPQSLVRCAGDSVILTVSANGTGLTYQWQKENQNIPGATSPSYIIPNAPFSASGEYRVIISGVGTCTGATSQSAVVFINQPTNISVQPENRTAVLGGAARLRVEAEVIEPATYQWYRGNQPLTNSGRINGATSSALTIQNVSQADVDSTYRVVVTGRCGSVTSIPVRIDISSVAISDFNLPEIGCVGTPVTLSATVNTDPQGLELNYRWTFNGMTLSNGGNISGAGTSNLTISNFSAADTGTYVLTVTAPSTGASASQTFRANQLGTAPSITVNPSSQAICPGATLALTGAASGNGTLQYQWLRNGQPISGANTVGYTTTFAGDMGGQYALVVTNACGTDTSAVATITARQSTAISENLPATTDAVENTELRLSVTASGEGNLSYQWYKDDQPVAGATGATLRIGSVSTSDAGRYRVVVRGECDSVVSVTTTVVVGPNSVLEIVESNGIILDQNSPNPFAGSTTVAFFLPSEMPVSIIVTDVLGRQVQEISLGSTGAGKHSVSLSGDQLPAGMYFYMLRTPQANLTRTFTVVK